MSEPIEVRDAVVLPVPSGLTITERSIEDAKRQMTMLRDFVQSQMRENVDYGVIPGTQKQSLYKPGAEKFSKLFGIGVRYVGKEKEIDRDTNFAMFTYMAEAYNLRTGVVLAQCEGSCNSHEKKYKTRKTKTGALEETPITDVMNTLQKMAQKRAYVGAIISATGASDFYTQDIDDPMDADQLGLRNRETTRVQANIPNATAARSQEQGNNPACCGRPMMVSKYPNRDTGAIDWYCTTCKASKPRT